MAATRSDVAHGRQSGERVDDPAMKRLVTEFARRVRHAVDAPAKAVEGEGSLDEPTATHDLHRMPQTGSLLFGRRNELKLLDDAWNGYTNLVAFTAGAVSGSRRLRVSGRRR